MKRKAFLFFMLLVGMCLSVLVSCNKDDDAMTETLMIASSRPAIPDYEGGTPYWAKKPGDTKWEIMHGPIYNFEYEEGYEYVILLKVEEANSPGPDLPDKILTVIRIISKEKKDSEVPLFTTDLSLCKDFSEEAFPYKQKTSVTLPNGVTLEKLDSLYIYQGDIVLNAKQVQQLFNGNSQARSGITTSSIKYWRGRKVYYTFQNGFTLQNNVQRAIDEWTNKTSLTFIQGKGNGNYIEFINGDGNYSTSLGMQGGKQTISLHNTLSNVGSAIHEIGHAVGLIHEHCRNDRDEYINVRWENIENQYKSQFNIYPEGETMDVGNFDFNSIMLYGSTAFAKEGLYSMTTKEGYFFSGQRLYLSTGDIEGIKAIYGPPFHKLSTKITVTREEIYGITDISEYDSSNIIYFYSDENYTQPTALTYPRYITVIKEKRQCNRYGDKVRETREYKQILVPAGATSYNLGTFHNIEWYTMSNPEKIDVTIFYVQN